MVKLVHSSQFIVHGKKKLPINNLLQTTNQLGFTLVESLIGITLASIVGVLLISTLTQNSNLFSNQNANINQGISLNQSSSQINDLVRSASSVATNNPIGSPLYTSGNEVLVLALPSINSSGDVIDNTYDYAVITKDTTNPKLLKEIIFPYALSTRKAKNQILSTKLSSLSFQYYNDSGATVAPNLATKINFVINQSEKAGNSDVGSSVSGQASLRNN